MAIPTGKKTDNGKIKYRIVSYKEGYLSPFANKVYDDNKKLSEAFFFAKGGRPIMIPCGKCTECKLQYAKKWSDRCMLELQHHDSSYFLTLTYDDEHLPKNDKGIPTLVKKDFQDFMKRLRERLDYPIRFYMCGEYGSSTHRPHYHAIIFGLRLNDLVFYSRNCENDNLYNSPFLDSVWKLGYVVVGDVTQKSCSYVARYVSKKVHSERSDYEKLNIVPEYTLMSRRPGIGADSFTPDIFRDGYQCLSTENGGIKVFPSRYYEKKYEELYPEEFAEYKAKRKAIAEDMVNQKALLSSMPFSEQLESEEENLVVRTSSLVRNQI